MQRSNPIINADQIEHAFRSNMNGQGYFNLSVPQFFSWLKTDGIVYLAGITYEMVAEITINLANNSDYSLNKERFEAFKQAALQSLSTGSVHALIGSSRASSTGTVQSRLRQFYRLPEQNGHLPEKPTGSKLNGIKKLHPQRPKKLPNGKKKSAVQSLVTQMQQCVLDDNSPSIDKLNDIYQMSLGSGGK